MSSDPKSVLFELFRAAVDSALPSLVLPGHLPPPPAGRTIVVGAGKAAASMAAALETHWPGPIEGLVVTRYGHRARTERIAVVEAGHPVPDAAGESAARAILDLVRGLGSDDLVIALISGGGSALLSLSGPGLTLADKQEVTAALLACGAPIGAINTVRKHLSAIKGGRLAAVAHPARVVTLAISDVPGDDPALVASGPTVGDPTSAADALAVLDRYRVKVSQRIRRALASGEAETPKPDDPRLMRAAFTFVATPQMALRAAALRAREKGIEPVILSDSIEGEAREVAKVLAAIARQVARYGEPAGAPCVLISGGETTVTVRGGGRGGRNGEFALALAEALAGAPGISAIACDTDGIDGVSDAAGAFVGPDTLDRARRLRLDLRARLDDNDAHGVFAALGDQVVIGPTLTNVNDFRAILIATEEGT